MPEVNEFRTKVEAIKQRLAESTVCTQPKWLMSAAGWLRRGFIRRPGNLALPALYDPLERGE